jgi:hypothetical protein
MIRRRRMVERLSDIWTTDVGNRVRVQIMDAPDISQEADFQPKRIALVSKASPVRAGTVITRGSDSFLLVAQSTMSDMVRFRALEITHRLPWKRNHQTIDPVSLMPVEHGTYIVNASLPVVVEPLRTVKELGFERPKKIIHTGAQVEVGDFLGEYEVHNIITALGVNLLEAY